MTQMLATRLQTLPPGKVKQREAAEREHTAQLQRLTLMLQGRGQQQKSRVRARIMHQKALVEDEFRRKAQIIIAVMNQRLVQEKAGLRQKHELVASSSPPAPAAPIEQDAEAQQTSLTAELAKRLEDVLEERLNKIEALIAAFKHNEQEETPQEVHEPDQEVHEPDQTSSKKEDDTSLTAYRLAVAEAVAAGCRYDKRPEGDNEASLASSSFGVLDITMLDLSTLAQTSVNQLDERMRARREFAELLLETVSPKEGPAIALNVVENFGRGNNGRGNYASFSDQGGKGTLYLSLSALHELSTGQLAVVMLHALAQARAQTSDLTEPQFISHLYALLVGCYQGLFAHVQQQRKAPSAGSTTTQQEERSRTSGAQASKSIIGFGQWQARLMEVEGFLTHMDSQLTSSASSHTLQHSQSSRLRSLERTKTGEASSGLWQQEQLQLVQEELDTAEKLYLQVLRQHEQQTQTVEYWQDLLAEQRDADYEEDAFDEEDEDGGDKSTKDDADTAERQRQREARAQEAQEELDRATQALDATRKDRDELFAQCQQLRDQLNALRGFRVD